MIMNISSITKLFLFALILLSSPIEKSRSLESTSVCYDTKNNPEWVVRLKRVVDTLDSEGRSSEHGF